MPRSKKVTKKNSTTTALSKDVKEKKKVPGRPFKKGQSGNPTGRPIGARDRRTVLWEAMKALSQQMNILPEELEVEMHTTALKKAIFKGSFPFYTEISNGLYGKIVDNMDIKSGGKSLADLLILANSDNRNRKRAKTTGKDKK